MRSPKIKQRANGIFFVEYYDVDGKRQRPSLKTKNHAEAQIRFLDFARQLPSTGAPPATTAPTNIDSGIRYKEAYNHFIESE